MKNYLFFERVLCDQRLDRTFYIYCLLRKFSLIHWLPRRIIMGILFAVGLCSEEKYYSMRWCFLRELDSPERWASRFWDSPHCRLHPIFRDGSNLWLSRCPSIILAPAAEKYGAELCANDYSVVDGCFETFKKWDGIVKEAWRRSRPALAADRYPITAQTGAETVYFFRGRAANTESEYLAQMLLGGILSALSLVLSGVVFAVMHLLFRGFGTCGETALWIIGFTALVLFLDFCFDSAGAAVGAAGAAAAVINFASSGLWQGLVTLFAALLLCAGEYVYSPPGLPGVRARFAGAAVTFLLTVLAFAILH